MKAVVAAFNQEKALVGAFSVITNLRMELFEALGAGAAAEASVRQVLGLVEAAPSIMRLGLVRAGLLTPDQELQMEDTAEVAAETRKLLEK